MSVVELGFYEPDGTTLIGTLTDEHLIECEARSALMELGALRLVVSRHLVEAEAALLAKGNIVKVTYPVIDPDPICVFVLKDDSSQLIDKDEEGGEHLEVTGPGALWLLQHARLREEVYAPEQPTRGDWDDDVSWNWRNRPYGGILVRCIEEGQNQPGTPLSAISIDFDRTVDSDGIPWASIAEDFSVPIGTDVLTVANRIAAAGDLFLILTPDMVLHAYQTYGRDLTGSFAADNVRFEKHVNVLTELRRKTKLDRVTHLITRDMDQVYRTYVTPDAFDQAVYGFLEVGWTNDEPQIEKTALTTLSASDNAAELYTVEIVPGDAPGDGEYLPGPAGTDGHFWYGDDVTLHTGTGEHDLNAEAAKVTAISIVLDVAADDSDAVKAVRSLHIVPELVIGQPAPAFSGVGNGAGAAGVGCICLRLCQSGTAGTALEDLDFATVETVNIYPSGTGDWPIGAGTWSNDPGSGGAGGLVYVTLGDTGNQNGPRLIAIPGVAYECSVDLSSAFGVSSVTATITFHAADHTVLLTETFGPISTNGGWETHGATLIAPAGSAYMQFGITGLGGYDNWHRATVGQPGDTPQPTVETGSASAGTSPRASRCDHEHEHGLLSDGGTHYHEADQIDGLSAGVTDHGALTGLADDDHPQYTTAAEVVTAIESNRYRAILTDGFDTLVWEGDDLVWEWVNG